MKIIDVEKGVFWGSSLSEKNIKGLGNDARLMFPSAAGDGWLGLSEHLCSRHLLIVGGIGTGKTNVFMQVLACLDSSIEKQDVVLVFDTKGDFYTEFYDPSVDIVIGNSRQFLKRTKFWNIFREIENGGETQAEKELMAREIVAALFESRKNTTQPFFTAAARDLFSKVLIGTMRRVLWSLPEYKRLADNIKNDIDREESIAAQKELFNRYAYKLNNRVLVEEILSVWTVEDYTDLLDEYRDFRSSKSFIGDGTSNQALGVFGEMQSMVNDYFVGVFADYQPGRDFAMRDLVHAKGGRKVFIEYDLSIGQVLAPLYTLLLDLALKEALGRAKSEGNVHLVIDEFKLLPKLRHMEDALNFGRSLGVKVYAGIQSIKQLDDVYGETKGQAMVAGFSNIFAFKMTDAASRKYVSELFGKNFMAFSYRNVGEEKKCFEREGYTVEDWSLLNLSIGEAVIGLAGVDPFLFRFTEYGKD